MIPIDDVYQNVKSLLRKNQQGYLPPGEFNRYANMANLSRFNEIYGRTQSIVNGKQTKEAYAQTQEIDEKLSVFLVSASAVSVNSTTGQVAKPDFLLRMDAVKHQMSSPVRLVKVRRRNKDQEADAAGSSVMPPTEEYPFYVDYGTLYQVYPKNIGTVDWAYLAAPTSVLWAYTLDGNNRQIFDSGSSIDFQFEGAEIGNIVAKILVYAAKSTADNLGVQLAAQLEAVGQ